MILDNFPAVEVSENVQDMLEGKHMARKSSKPTRGPFGNPLTNIIEQYEQMALEDHYDFEIDIRHDIFELDFESDFETDETFEKYLKTLKPERFSALPPPSEQCIKFPQITKCQKATPMEEQIYKHFTNSFFGSFEKRPTKIKIEKCSNAIRRSKRICLRGTVRGHGRDFSIRMLTESSINCGNFNFLNP